MLAICIFAFAQLQQSDYDSTPLHPTASTNAMASNRSAFPREITDLIVDELANSRTGESDTHDLYNCSLVSSTFRERSQRRLLEFIRIVSSTDEAGIAKNARTRRILETDTRIASYVRSAHLSFYTDMLPASLPGFEGPPLILPNLRELKITEDGGFISLQCNDMVPEFLETIKNLMRSPGLETLILRNIEPPMEVVRTSSRLKHLELRPELAYDTPFIALPTRSSRVSRCSPPTPNYLDTMISLHYEFELDLALLDAEEALRKAGEPPELSMTRVANYIAFRTEVVQRTLNCIDSDSLRCFSVGIVDPYIPVPSFSLSSFPNLDTLEFALSGPRPDGYYAGYQGTLGQTLWPFIRRTLLSLPPSNKLATFCLTSICRDDISTEDWSQANALLSDRTRFENLQQVFISLFSQPPIRFTRSPSPEGVFFFPPGGGVWGDGRSPFVGPDSAHN
ncbi:hypothetical protein DXG01_008974 [Tephrocybe rancida]|nr:hypothetical protein DXG01_008974 [Tephrocybe rancida]